MNSIAPMFESGMVYATEDAFAEEVIEELAAFPFGENDDFCDSTTMALMRIRQGGLVELDSDYQEDMQVDRTALSYY
jgi:phage terminase large subunit-like protein